LKKSLEMATQKALARQQVGATGTANVLRDQESVPSKESKLTYIHTHTHEQLQSKTFSAAAFCLQLDLLMLL